MNQEEIDRLLDIEKVFIGNRVFILPTSGKSIFSVESKDGVEKFEIIFHQNSKNFKKMTSINMELFRDGVSLVRMDFGEISGHRNPDDKILKGSHLHLYSEKHQDKFTISIPNGLVSHNDRYNIFDLFLDYCKVIKKSDLVKKLE